MLLPQFIRESAGVLEALYPPQEARSLVLRLCGDVLGTQSYTHIVEPQYEIPSGKLATLQDAVARLAAGEPLQYITGWQEFCGRRFRVTPDVLIPRPETEMLVAEATKHLRPLLRSRLLSPCTPRGEGDGSPSAADAAIPSVGTSCLRTSNAIIGPLEQSGPLASGAGAAHGHVNGRGPAQLGGMCAEREDSEAKGPGCSSRPRVLDLFTGSGCIAWSIALEVPGAEVIGVDISEAALYVASSQFPTEPPRFVKADVLQVPEEFPGALFDVITANPPYIREREKSRMHRNVLEHEPELALFVPDDDPLLFYRALAQWARRFLKPGGWGIAEINEELGDETKAVFSDAGLGNVKKVPDFYGKDRFVTFEKTPCSSVGGV